MLAKYLDHVKWELCMWKAHMPRLWVGTLLLVATTAVQAQPCRPDYILQWCEDMRAQAQFERADHKLNAAYRRLLRQMSKPRDEYIDYPALKAKFMDAQRQWIRFRDAECDAWFIVNQAGTGRNVSEMACLIDRTNDRTKQLNAWLTYVPSR
ncbi:hypothetical protein WT83_28815 [Burkholderia territorii]|uniref:Lysozyme inhibitor LprI-like N-terminal domain-containing protein n=1 Tax=Burkholderia territorii TaxID=1503055 RepID=A0A119VDV5_9BURK|nr:lysozyme inhibitor LprI family protein [Burkholderia territorii]KWN05581.1 hypothetical protein WT83_28815 [Burkholderia territorii]